MRPDDLAADNERHNWEMRDHNNSEEDLSVTREFFILARLLAHCKASLEISLGRIETAMGVNARTRMLRGGLDGLQIAVDRLLGLAGKDYVPLREGMNPDPVDPSELLKKFRNVADTCESFERILKAKVIELSVLKGRSQDVLDLHAAIDTVRETAETLRQSARPKDTITEVIAV